MKLSKRLSQPELSAAVDLLERGRKAIARHEWEQGETQEAWDRAVATFFATLKAQLDYEQEADHASPPESDAEAFERDNDDAEMPGGFN